MFGIGVCYSENATLFGRPDDKRHIKSQPLEVTLCPFIIEWPAGKMGYVAIPIWNALFTSKGC